MYGTEQLAQAIIEKRDHDPLVRKRVNNSPEPLRTLVYAGLGEEIAMHIDGTDLYHEIVDHLENMY